MQQCSVVTFRRVLGLPQPRAAWRRSRPQDLQTCPKHYTIEAQQTQERPEIIFTLTEQERIQPLSGRRKSPRASKDIRPPATGLRAGAGTVGPASTASSPGTVGDKHRRKVYPSFGAHDCITQYGT
ncbi:hypothetical protein EVAR_49889_1 [Eumeta japonica]|uniref:Uncharacterized protein n=1 Tax=Eumeta variegata TaxID=151549 RepID=A0A4C1XWS7_EUMVA|nr:hypothetical protein EVAR_49889_1 [Eumeta japonica]